MEPGSGSNVIPRRVRPDLAGLRPHTVWHLPTPRTLNPKRIAGELVEAANGAAGLGGSASAQRREIQVHLRKDINSLLFCAENYHTMGSYNGVILGIVRNFCSKFLCAKSDSLICLLRCRSGGPDEEHARVGKPKSSVCHSAIYRHPPFFCHRPTLPIRPRFHEKGGRF